MEARVYFDGSARPNPGRGAFGLLAELPGKTVERSGVFPGTTTNNQAEYLAFLEAVRLVRELGLRAATLFSDSELLVKAYHGEWRLADPTLRALLQRAREEEEGLSLSLAWIPRERNPAHKLAERAQRGPHPPPGPPRGG